MKRSIAIAACALAVLFFAALAWADSSAAREAFKKGITFDLAGKHMEAAKWFRKAADQGSEDAQYYLGQMFRSGQGLLQGYAEAAKWYRRAAEQGHVLAQYILGLMNSIGQGVPQDYAEAEIWFRKAAEQGHQDAQSNLGVMYGTGTAVSRDDVLAHMWFNLAAISGSKTGKENLDLLTKQMTPRQIAEARRLAREWKPKLK
jgi:TPR repeat protein